MEPEVVINVSDLSKSFSDHPVLKSISFQVNRGEIVGFLGPNGAGKTTSMRVLTGFFPPDSGHVTVFGEPIHQARSLVRQRVGYLPENPPLYLDMTVWSYLMFVAELKKVERSVRSSAMASIMDQLLISDVKHKIIGQLSKGYRQRVGLAQALVHNPEVVILDEPTSGLDPKQIKYMRSLISNLAGTHTVLLSTHRLSEVTEICQKVVIIRDGKIVTTDTISSLVENRRAVVVAIEGPLETIHQAIEQLDWVSQVSRIESIDHCHRFRVTGGQARVAEAALYRLCVENNWVLTELGVQASTLEDIFIELTDSDGHH